MVTTSRLEERVAPSANAISASIDAKRLDEPFTSPYLTEQIITYIGNKRALLGFISSGVERVRSRLGRERISSFDVFAGSGIVSRFLATVSERLTACDLELYAAILNRCYLSDRRQVDQGLVRSWIDRMNEAARTSPIDGVISELYAPVDDECIRAGERVFYTRRNARYLDTARQVIDRAPDLIRDHLLAPLLYVASVHANTAGVFKGFYKDRRTGIGQFGGTGRDALKRICKPLEIPYPLHIDHVCACTVRHGDANAIARETEEVDLAYIDPPYNQHPYGSNYFMLNLIAENRRPRSLSPVSGIPSDWTRSDYNKRSLASSALENLVRTLRARFLLVSFNSEGFIDKDEMLALLGTVGRVEVLETPYFAFRGSRNLASRSLRTTEYLFLVDKRRPR
jgi:adenine-specific DNA-methyltransferase